MNESLNANERKTMNQSLETSFQSNEQPKTELEIARAEVEVDARDLVDALVDTPEQFVLNDLSLEDPEYNGDGEQQLVQATTRDRVYVRASRTQSSDSEVRNSSSNRYYQLQIIFGIGGDAYEVAFSEGSKRFVMANHRDVKTGEVRDAKDDVECLSEIQTAIELFRESAKANTEER